MEKLLDVFLTMFNVQDLGSLKNVILVLIGKLISAFLILVLAWIVIGLGNKFIHKVMNKDSKSKLKAKKDLSAFESIVKSVLKVFVYIIAIFSILTGVFGILDASSLVTTVGVGGLALSIGAQSLISDIISGFFLLYENQVDIGDYITLEGISGNVTALELRCLKLETYEGETVFVPYGEIRNLINKSKSESSIIVDIPVSYKEDVDKVTSIMEDVIQEYENNELTENLRMLPPVSLDEKTYSLRMFGKGKPCSNWDIERELRKAIIDKAKANNIKIGFDLDD
ncbi:MAG: mechanosensitive ion channel family protein [Clostridia bacterium]|nr:mechanosensitive ion channel family protein [Clostridia bacterium]